MKEPGKLLRTETFAVRWGDMDALGHVNNTEYFRYMEQTRISWLDTLGVAMSPGGSGPVIVKAACEFVKPINYPETVAVSMHFAGVGRSSFTVTHEIRSAGDPALLYALGEVVTVWVDYARGRSVPLPEAVRRALA